MVRLESIQIGSRIIGLVNNETVTIVSTQRFGNNALQVVYKDSSGKLASEILYRERESELSIENEKKLWQFDADGNYFKLASEAYRIHLAYLFDPYTGIHSSSIQPLPHQITAVYQEMLPRFPLRYVLADDPGAGKTIMTGLLLKELLIRGDVKRCLIVAPGSLVEQWQDELKQKFNLWFELLTNERAESAPSGNIFNEINFCIARLDKLNRDDGLQEKLRHSEWDLIVVDEAHKMSAHLVGSKEKPTKRYKLGVLLRGRTRHFLLLTATPHNGNPADFQLFMALIDPDRFAGVKHAHQLQIDVVDVMRRLTKEKLLKLDGTPLFPERIATTLAYDLSDNEIELYEEVTKYVRTEFNRADKLKDKKKKSTVGFALSVLQRRLASSPRAIFESLRRRRARLEQKLRDCKNAKVTSEIDPDIDWEDVVDGQYQIIDEDDFSAEELEKKVSEISDQASTAETMSELEREIDELQRLEAMAGKVCASGKDRKWNELSKLLLELEPGAEADGRKLIIFTEHRDTLEYLYNRITTVRGNEGDVVVIHGGMKRDDRRRVEEQFKQDKHVKILIATDAAGEGINLQRANLMINYDLPWNPNRLEQRFGRIHRIGQTEVCHLWNLVARGTLEGGVFLRLFQKIEEKKAALGDSVFNVLGKLTFGNRPLRDFIIEAIRYGNDPKVREQMEHVVDETFDPETFSSLAEEHALANEILNQDIVRKTRADLEREGMHNLQPYYIRAFLQQALESFKGSILRREKGRYEIKRVPVEIRDKQLQGASVLKEYERICFDKDYIELPGKPTAALITLGHPLLNATISLVQERYGGLLKQGTVLIDECGNTAEPRILVYIEEAIQDGVVLQNGSKRVVSKRVHFVEIYENGDAYGVADATYLGYRAVEEGEYSVIRKYIETQKWIQTDIEEKAVSYAIENLIPSHFKEVKEKIHSRNEKIEKAVKDRLTAEIQYWDQQAAELSRKENDGKPNKRSDSETARHNAEECDKRLKLRLQELRDERNLSPASPILIGAALVLPQSLVDSLMGRPVDPARTKETKAVEDIGMDAVTKIELELGYLPKDVSKKRDKCGYDIESEIPESLQTGGPSLRFIEVKGRRKGEPTVSVTINEIRAGLRNPENFILALVEVDGKTTHTTYLKNPFEDENASSKYASINFKIKELLNGAEVLLEKDGVIEE